VVSHDRHFLSCIANKIWWIEDQQLKEYPGTYEEFEEWQKLNAARKQAPEKEKASQSAKEVKSEKKKSPVNSLDEQEKKQLKKWKQQFEKIEAELATVNEKKKAMEAELAKPEVFGDADRFQKSLAGFSVLEEQSKRMTEEWESLFEKINEIEG
jgi:ATP-binding cassette subfamily F protein 3